MNATAKQLSFMDVFLMNEERVEEPIQERVTQLEGYERDSMMKSWFGIEDLDTYFYRSTPDKGSPYDLSVHHTHKYMKFDIDAFHSYIGAGLLTCLDALPESKRLLPKRDEWLRRLGQGLTDLERLEKNKIRANYNIDREFERLDYTLEDLDAVLVEMEYELLTGTSNEYMWGELIEFKGMLAILEEGHSTLFEGEDEPLVYRLLDVSDHPRYSSNLRHDDYSSIQANETTRASMPTRYYGDTKGAGPYLTLIEREEEALGLLRNALLKSDRPVFSSSFGKDSLVTLHLGLRACDLLNIPRHKIDVFYSDTLNEFDEVRQLAKAYAKQEGFNLIVARPEKTLKRIIQEHGGIDESYFSRKGDRRKTKAGASMKPLSEKCCDGLKHQPFYQAVATHRWDLNAVGTRTDESRQRKQAGLRDGEYFYWKTGRMHKIQPILHWTDEEVFAYIEKYQLQLPSLYYQNLILDYPVKKRKSDPELPIQEALDHFGVKDGVVERPLDALQLKKMGFKVYMPRVGCMLCPTPIKHGYLRWLRAFYPKVFKGMLSRLGYATQLVKMIPEEKRMELEFMLGQPITSLTIMENPELVESMLEYMPCAFDQLK